MFARVIAWVRLADSAARLSAVCAMMTSFSAGGVSAGAFAAGLGASATGAGAASGLGSAARLRARFGAGLTGSAPPVEGFAPSASVIGFSLLARL